MIKVICHTDECWNNGHEIFFSDVTIETIVFCGPCSQEITDKTEVIDSVS